MDVPSVSNKNENQEKDEGNVVTMVDVLEEENELEEDANAVLGGSDDKTCTYSKGYVLRQPLYSCKTCNPVDNGTLAGICLGCSYKCHENHELVELYTKRNFRCDCGNSLFPNNKCNLEPVKDEINNLNSYNQNFTGVYCTCKRPYPDPEDNTDDEMIQCIVCEDWFHGRHLGNKEQASLEFGEMICQQCMEKHSFLWKYSGLCVKKCQKESGENLNVSITEGENEKVNGEAKLKEEEKSKEENCYLKTSNLEVESGSTFWPEGWRKHLCQCTACLKLYEEEKISFLLNETDTVQYYENKNKETAKETQYERGMKALSSLDRVKQVEAIEGYNQMKAELMGYLQKFAENRKVVREEDIREFFSQMEARKKVKVEMPYFCR